MRGTPHASQPASKLVSNTSRKDKWWRAVVKKNALLGKCSRHSDSKLTPAPQLVQHLVATPKAAQGASRAYSAPRSGRRINSISPDCGHWQYSFPTSSGL